jgi:hypothetical protein
MDLTAQTLSQLSETELLALWDKRDDYADDEYALIRTALRKLKGVRPYFKHNIHTCPSCQQVEENCTCGRSWF